MEPRGTFKFHFIQITESYKINCTLKNEKINNRHYEIINKKKKIWISLHPFYSSPSRNHPPRNYSSNSNELVCSFRLLPPLSSPKLTLALRFISLWSDRISKRISQAVRGLYFSCDYSSSSLCYPILHQTAGIWDIAIVQINIIPRGNFALEFGLWNCTSLWNNFLKQFNFSCVDAIELFSNDKQRRKKWVKWKTWNKP